MSPLALKRDERHLLQPNLGKDDEITSAPVEASLFFFFHLSFFPPLFPSLSHAISPHCLPVPKKEVSRRSEDQREPNYPMKWTLLDPRTIFTSGSSDGADYIDLSGGSQEENQKKSRFFIKRHMGQEKERINIPLRPAFGDEKRLMTRGAAERPPHSLAPKRKIPGDSLPICQPRNAASAGKK